ncbi:hypothetical protein SY2F82_74100 [Streptomyces sp. Y2F8-2]|nr:hypothetical protein SY2F82_74100 [Streptomyces sp. Y2F8-2]
MQEGEAGPAEHLALEHLDPVDMTFDDARVPGQGEAGDDGVMVSVDAGGERVEAGQVVLPDSVEPVRQALSGRCRRQDVQTAAVPRNTPLGGFAQVAPETPPIGDLDRLRRPGCGAFGEERAAVPADDLDARPFGEPGGQAESLPGWEETDRTAGFDVHQDSAAVAVLAGGVLVDADDPRRGLLRLR